MSVGYTRDRFCQLGNGYVAVFQPSGVAAQSVKVEALAIEFAQTESERSALGVIGLDMANPCWALISPAGSTCHPVTPSRTQSKDAPQVQQCWAGRRAAVGQQGRRCRWSCRESAPLAGTQLGAGRDGYATMQVALPGLQQPLPLCEGRGAQGNPVVGCQLRNAVDAKASAVSIPTGVAET